MRAVRDHTADVRELFFDRMSHIAQTRPTRLTRSDRPTVESSDVARSMSTL